MPRAKGQIPSYKNVVRATPGTQPALPPPMTDEDRAAADERLAAKKREEEREAQLAHTKIPHKILTPMEMRARAIHLMNERGYDPIRSLIALVRSPDIDVKLAIDIHKHLAKFVYPEQKAVDLQVAGDLNVTVNVVKFSTADGQRLAPNREAIPVRAVEIAS